MFSASPKGASQVLNLFWFTGRSEEAFTVLVVINGVVSLCVFL